MAVILDLDMTLVDSSLAEAQRTGRRWTDVYALIPRFRVYPGARELLVALQEARLAVCIVTSSPRPYCAKVTAYHGLDVTDLVCYHDTNRHKPDPQPYFKAMELMGVSDPARVIACGDAPADIVAGCKAGMATAACLWASANPEALRALGPTYLCDDVPSLHQAILRHELR